MFDRFTDRARKVMNLAKQEAQRLMKSLGIGPADLVDRAYIDLLAAR